MRKNPGAIPVNKFGDDNDGGISIERLSLESFPDLTEWVQPERHDRHTFFVTEEGSVTMEIDFQKFRIGSPSLIYMHPDQVHRIIAFENVTVTAWGIDNNNLAPDYLKLLEGLTPTTPLSLNQEAFNLLSDSISVSLKLAKRINTPLYHRLLKDQVNALVSLSISFFMECEKPVSNASRSETITKAFRETLAAHFTVLKRPAEYAEKLNLSIPYLNECVKSTTGQPVSYHIQQRVILEAKRLLYHSDQSLKEIAATLGYDDYTYFSRLFAKVAGMSPVAFRQKNLD
ncbi:helix-turn-helix transcriptional regulator [Mucilaginibacter sp. CAU 1740]|uniref:helix-turn-helix transcriptional regulator n=1 Tax=Mucilaginibacter sp. CAU 1740 TaxID=3140365 RepID=UPI00325B8E0D